MVSDHHKKKGKPGRKPTPIDWDEAKRMRDKYKRIGEIAAYFKVSDNVITRGFRIRGIK